MVPLELTFCFFTALLMCFQLFCENVDMILDPIDCIHITLSSKGGGMVANIEKAVCAVLNTPLK
jgi:hypothetical protein